MRVTSQMMVESAIRSMGTSLERLSYLQKQVAQGKKIQEVSDGPATAVAGLSLRSTLTAGKAFLETATVSAAWMEANETAMSQMIDLATRANNLVSQGLSDTLGAQQRHALATEISALLESAVTVANTSHQGNFLFGGFKTQSAPFTLNEPPDSVTPPLDGGAIVREIGPGQTVRVNVDARALFSDLFESLIDARDALDADNTTTLAAARQDLAAALDQISESRSLNGARLRELGRSVERMERIDLDLRALLTQIEEVDMTEAISLLRLQETAYQAVLETSRRILNTPSLFEVISA